MSRLRLIGAVAVSLGVLAGCGGKDPRTLTFWAMGAEGEKVGAVLAPFVEAHPEIKLKIQAIPWGAAHDKLLTAYAGGVTPDACQLGSTWVTELQALGALAPLDARIASSPVVKPADYFKGVWEGNRLEGKVYGIPWYVDTRALFYRKDLLAEAGAEGPPATWREFETLGRKLTRDTNGDGRPDRYGAFLPVNPSGDPVPLYMAWQRGADLIDPTRLRGTAAQPAFAAAAETYVGFFKRGIAPREAGNVTNFYQAFAHGDFAMFVSGPWNVEGLHQKVPAIAGKWAVAPLPAVQPGGARTSLAGGSSLVVFQRSTRQDAAWALIEYLSRPEVQQAFHAATSDLPARKSAWAGPALSRPEARAFFDQLQDARPAPMVPEWEQLASRLGTWIERAAFEKVTVGEAMAGLDVEIDQILEKRRWLAARRAGTSSEGGSR